MTVHRVYRLDERLTVVAELGQVSSISVTRDGSDESSLLSSCKVEVHQQTPEWVPGWFRIDRMDARRDMLGVFWLEAKSSKQEAGRVTLTLEGQSVLKSADEATLPNGSYIRYGTDGVAYARDLLRVCPGRVSVAGSEVVPSTIVFDDDTSNLRAAWQVLDAIGWRVRLEGNGDKVLEPLPMLPSLTVGKEDTVPGISLGDSVSYERAFDWGVNPLDLIRVNVPNNGIDLTWRVSSQSYSPGQTMKDTLKETVR